LADRNGGAQADRLPKIFYVNWFRRDADGGFLWPGFRENSRVLKWVIDRLDGLTDGVVTPIGLVPAPEELDVSGLDLPAGAVEAAVAVVAEEWRAELPLIEEWFATFGDALPKGLRDELDALRLRLDTTR
jgi:phosphoenolpyruvate carboxykinase (GTP)